MSRICIESFRIIIGKRTCIKLSFFDQKKSALVRLKMDRFLRFLRRLASKVGYVSFNLIEEC